MEKLVVSHSPFIHSGNDINKMFFIMSIALLIPSAFGVSLFGVRSLYVIVVSLATCFLSESLFNLVTEKKFIIHDFSFLVTGFILALTLPYTVPIYVVAISAFFSIFIVKMVFGGLGRNKFNPANTGRCLAGMIAPALSSELYRFTINGEEFVSFTEGGTNTFFNLISGRSVGGIGTTCCVIMIVCFVFLIITKVIDFKIPLIAIISYIIMGCFIFGIEKCFYNICSGSFLFICIFILTDPNTSPNSIFSKIVYSALFGVLSALLWKYSMLGENSLFVLVLVMNILSMLMDKCFIIKPVKLGGFRNAYKK